MFAFCEFFFYLKKSHAITYRFKLGQTNYDQLKYVKSDLKNQSPQIISVPKEEVCSYAHPSLLYSMMHLTFQPPEVTSACPYVKYQECENVFLLIKNKFQLHIEMFIFPKQILIKHCIFHNAKKEKKEKKKKLSIYFRPFPRMLKF